MGVYKSLTLSPAIDVDGIVQSVDPANNATLTLNGAYVAGGVATLPSPHRVVITSAADDSAVTFTLTGTDRYGASQTEAVTGSNASTAASVFDFKTVTSIVVTGNAGSITVGIDGRMSSAWIPLNTRAANRGVGFSCEPSSGASLTYSVEHTFWPIQESNQVPAVNILTHDAVASETTKQDGNYLLTPHAMRITTTAYTSGTLIFRWRDAA